MGLVQNMFKSIFNSRGISKSKLKKMKPKPDQFITGGPEAPSNQVYTSAFKRKGKGGAGVYATTAKSIEELLAEQAAMTGFK